MKMNIKFSLTISMVLFSICNFAQNSNPTFWAKNGNAVVGLGNTFGTFYPAPINVFTGSVQQSQFTFGNALSNLNNPLATQYPGDGLRIFDPTPLGVGHLDIWAGSSNTTHIQFGKSGNIDGQFTRFEVTGRNNGLWLNAHSTAGYNPRIFFNINDNEVGRFNPAANQGFMRIGFQPFPLAPVDAARRLEVYDAAAVPQFRITQAIGVSGSKFTDIQTTTNGDLAILPFNSTLSTTAKFTFVGIQTVTPGNTLEINSQAASPILPSANGSSGLRFTDLKYGASTPATPLNNQGVLSVDAFGDVVYITSPTVGFGGDCNTPPVLAIPSGVDLNANPFIFLGTALNSKVGIGTSCGNSLRAKLMVEQSSGAGTGTIGIHVLNSDQSVLKTVYGIFSILNPTTLSPSDVGYTAGFFYAHASKLCIGVDGLADGLFVTGTSNYGGRFTARNGGSNYGIWAEASGNNSWAGWFEGNINVNGIYYINTLVFSSDRNLKTNIDTIANALSILGQIQPKTFFYDSIVHPQMHLSDRRQYGMIAQDVETVLPELVEDATFPAKYDSLGNVISASFTYKTLNYNAFIAILIKGMQEQNAKIDSLQNQINSCCSSSARMSNQNNSIANQTDVTLTNSESIVLNQNVPNPFAEQTTITYNLPESVQKAQLLFYDATGKLIKAVDLTGRGNGQINVFANDLSNGIYSYALVADGNVVDTKRMVKTQ